MAEQCYLGLLDLSESIIKKIKKKRLFENYFEKVFKKLLMIKVMITNIIAIN